MNVTDCLKRDEQLSSAALDAGFMSFLLSKAAKKQLVAVVSLLALSKAFSATALALVTINDFGLAIRDLTQIS
jgi:DNA-binding NarL/FixJ family response regulator